MAQPHRLKHRIPVKLRHNWKLVALCTAFLAVCWGVFGSGTVRPYVTTSGTVQTRDVVQDLTGTRELFDTSVPHEVTLTFRDESYQDMLAEYFKDGEKKYVEADLTIDGTRIPSVGIRLKGNSTLQGLTWKGQTRPRSGPGGRQTAAGPRPTGGHPPTDRHSRTARPRRTQTRSTARRRTTGRPSAARRRTTGRASRTGRRAATAGLPATGRPLRSRPRSRRTCRG